MISWSKFALDILKTNFNSLKAPYRYFLVVTKSCQSRCQHCKIWQEVPENELRLEDFERIAKQSPFLKWLNISGGEPTDRDDLLQITMAFKKHCPDLLMLNFTTNGLEPEKIEMMASKIASLNIKKLVINVSIDGPKEIHDILRGVKGNYESAIDTYKRLKAIKGVESKVGMTLFKKNFSLINETIKAIQKDVPGFTGKDLHLNIPHTSAHYYKNENMNFKAQIEILEEVDRFKKEYGFGTGPLGIIESLFHKHSKAFLVTGKTAMACSALMSSVYISEKGVVFPCTIWDKPLGNIKDYDFNVVKLLNTQESLKVRTMARNLKCPQCWTPCEAFPTILSNLVAAI